MSGFELETFTEHYEFFIGNCNPESYAIHFNDIKVANYELREKVELYTMHLEKMGVGPGSCVGYTMPNCPEIFYLFIAISRLGGCTVPLFHMVPDIAKANIYKNCRVQYVVTTSKQFDSLKDSSDKVGAGYKIATIDDCPNADYNFTNGEISANDHKTQEVNPDMPLLMTSSSGTTGTPKFVIMTQSNVAAAVKSSVEMVSPVNIFGKDGYSTVMAFPLSTAGIIVSMGIMFGGVTLIYSDDISPVKYLQLLTEYKADSMSAPPAYFEAILSLPMLGSFDLTTAKKVLTGMDFFSPSLLKRLKTKFRNIMSASNGYGLTETSNVFMVWKACDEFELENPTNVLELVGNVGNEIDVRDEEGKSVPDGTEGELYVKGTSVVGGYVGNDEETKASFIDGWFKTGDVVRKEGNSTITLLGRKKYLIKRGGKSISPIVVQNHINKLFGVKDSAVVGIPHQLYGEMIWAFIVKANGTELLFKDVMKHCRTELPNYMVPDQVNFIEEIPKNPGVGKVNFEKLREMANKELQSLGGGNNG